MFSYTHAITWQIGNLGQFTAMELFYQDLGQWDSVYCDAHKLGVGPDLLSAAAHGS